MLLFHSLIHSIYLSEYSNWTESSASPSVLHRPPRVSKWRRVYLLQEVQALFASEPTLLLAMSVFFSILKPLKGGCLPQYGPDLIFVHRNLVTHVSVLGECEHDYQFSCWSCVTTVPSRTIHIWELLFPQSFPSFFWNSAAREWCTKGAEWEGAECVLATQRLPSEETKVRQPDTQPELGPRMEMKNKRKGGHLRS